MLRRGIAQVLKEPILSLKMEGPIYHSRPVALDEVFVPIARVEAAKLDERFTASSEHSRPMRFVQEIE